MYGVPLPPQSTQPAGQINQGVPTQSAAPQWGGAGYQNQYEQQRQQMQQQLASLQRPNAPMPGQQQMAGGGMATMPAGVMQPPVQGALNYAVGGQAPKSMQDVPQAPAPTGPGGVANGPALVPQAAQAHSPLGQNGVATGLYTPKDYQPIIAAAPNAQQMSSAQRNLGIFTADSTPQYMNRSAPQSLGPQGQSPDQFSLDAQVAAILGHAQGGPIDYSDIGHQHQRGIPGGGADIDFTGGGQPLDYSAGRKRDTIPALLDHGEYVWTRKAVQGIGAGDIGRGGKLLGALMRHFEGKA